MNKVITFCIYLGLVLVTEHIKAQANAGLDTLYFIDVTFKPKFFTADMKGKIGSDSTIVKFNNKDSIIMYSKRRTLLKEIKLGEPKSVEVAKIIYSKSEKRVITIHGNYKHIINNKEKKNFIFYKELNLDTIPNGSILVIDYKLKDNFFNALLLDEVKVSFKRTVFHKLLGSKRKKEKTKKELLDNNVWEYNYVTGQLKRINE